MLEFGLREGQTCAFGHDSVVRHVFYSNLAPPFTACFVKIEHPHTNFCRDAYAVELRPVERNLTMGSCRHPLVRFFELEDVPADG